MLSITRVTLTPWSDGKGHAGTALQHSHAGGYELHLFIAILLTKDIPTFLCSLWVGPT